MRKQHAERVVKFHCNLCNFAETEEAGKEYSISSVSPVAGENDLRLLPPRVTNIHICAQCVSGIGQVWVSAQVNESAGEMES